MCGWVSSSVSSVQRSHGALRKSVNIDTVQMQQRNASIIASRPPFPSLFSSSLSPSSSLRAPGPASPFTTHAGSVEEVEYDPATSNSLSLMGIVGSKQDVRYFESGNKVSSFGLAFTSQKDGETQWFNVELWGPLADAVDEIDKGQRVVVEGRLKVDSWTSKQTNEQKKSLKIVANAVKKVKYSGSMKAGGGASPQGASYQQQQQQRQYPSGQLATAEEQWMSYFEDPSQWYDNRPRKAAREINEKAPDFKKREGGREAPALWIDSSTTPAWVKQELAQQEAVFGGGGGGAGGGGGGAQPPF